NDSVFEINDGKRMKRDADGRDDEAVAEAGGCDKHCFAWAGLLEPSAEESSRESQDGDGNRKNVADFFQGPGAAISSFKREQRIFENAECVNLPNGKVYRKSRRGN